MSSIADKKRYIAAKAAAVHLPRNFIFGGATSAYQIEGAWDADGKGESIWDRFCRRPGAIIDKSSGDIACDHFHLYPRDIEVMKDLKLDAYRFSVAWARVQPDGSGLAHAKGLDFYNRLVDALLAQDIKPFLTLYHWDLPQALQDKGGWYNRDTAHHFADYADLVSRALGDRIKHWTTLNEPWTFCWSGHATGEDAPGLADGAQGGLTASHHALLAHGLAVPVIRANVPDAAVGIVLDLNVASPASDAPEDVAAARRFDGAQNRWYLDAVFKGSYPADIIEVCADLLPEIRDGDNAIIAAPVDYLGVNIYRRSIMADGTDLPPLNFRRISPEGEYTAVGYEIWPACIHDILMYVHENYAPPAIHISESGMATLPETPDREGRIDDIQRAEYYVDHLAEMARAMAKGVPVQGYFAWTLMDNFEWAFGYTTPFGVVHVDYTTQERRIKFSGETYRNVILSRSDH